jgi:CheY-like chemotaxis protein
MEALGGSRGVDPRRDGNKGSNIWFSFPYRPDYSYEFNNQVSLDSGDNPLFAVTNVSSDGKIKSSEILPPLEVSMEKMSSLKISGSKRCSIKNLLVSRTLSVLLIDDSPTIVKGLSRSLRKSGYLVTTASNGSVGLDLLIKGYDMNEFDFVLMDLQMPVMDGIEAVTRYREFERVSRKAAVISTLKEGNRKRLPIIGMSANSDNATKLYALEAGMNLFIPKPFILAELELLICQLISNSI